MMKFSHAINTLVASVLVLPAVTLQGQREGGLEAALADTVRALEFLTGLESRAKNEPRTAVPMLRDVTESPLPDARERDERLVALRNEVARLQMIHDDLASRGDVTPGTTALAIDPNQPPVPLALTTGLSDADRTSISGAPPPRPTRAPIGETIEAAGFCADAARRGQALYRAGRYQECADFLKSIENDIRATYWLARAQEKLGQSDDALKGYRIVAQSKDDASLAERANADAQFLEWQREFAKKAGAKSKSTEARH